MKNVPKLQEVAEFMRNAAYADNQNHGIEWSMRVLHPRTDWGVTNFACGIWHSHLNRKELNADVSISFSYDESKGFYHFGLWVDKAKIEMPFGDTPTFDELKDTVIKEFKLKKLYKQDLFMYLAKCTKGGHVVTGVNEISKYSNRRPKVAVKTDPEYKKILKSVMSGDE